MEQLNKTILKVIKNRPTNSHKANYGRVLIIAGSKQYAGAAVMASSAAVYAGAGLVTLATDPSVFTAINITIPEVMTVNYNKDFSKELEGSDVIAIGPGLPANFEINSLKNLIEHLTNKQTLIIDATALNTLAQDISILNNCQAFVILTPHQMEWQRISGIKIFDQTTDKNIEYINSLSSTPTIILKKHQTEIHHENSIYKNIAGNPGMATGGSGDTLTGIIAAFCSQFKTNIDTINAAVFTHSDLANELYKNNYVVLPEQLIKHLPEYMKKAAH
ncbi:ADP-dependent (S)-NAD(P)H-hydrate dehydratase [Companilactobacillus sp. RD055328]|uniref:NAD(P)H-hydrate dehydratase n=1 Tax=Companilactobacillus sp. RD055328 TaxID=2916634 RepID=UPI001FC89769|nr:NAD(P)H-hydrate dehydratase [Companilactobacillus sp. RD055328]GKQ42478.1 ADP-dependent (S)-NAD(P)H-hydrate dehydratase [Companilactobacillus sp. RD055328]